MSKPLRFTIFKMQRWGKILYRISIPTRFAASGEKTDLYYKTRAEAEAVHDITKIIESKKIDLELNRLQNSNTDALFKSRAMKDSMELALRRNQLDGKKIELDGKKVELEFEKLDLDRSKLILDKERLELEFNKVLKDIHILERGYRHDVSKLNIGIIKEITDSISIVMKLVTLGKSLFSGD